jgi:hypothetical protein
MYVALKFVPEGTKMTVHTDKPGRALTNEVAVLRKEPNNGGWGDWQILSRPKTADASLIPATRPQEQPEIIYSKDLAQALSSDPNLWATIAD